MQLCPELKQIPPLHLLVLFQEHLWVDVDERADVNLVAAEDKYVRPI
jgi:hypothetical protein